MTRVTPDQFHEDENTTTHKPTGARFSWYRGSRSEDGPAWVYWGTAGDVLPIGEDFDRSEILAMAMRLRREREQVRRGRK
jgi:hypothetical protein